MIKFILLMLLECISSLLRNNLSKHHQSLLIVLPNTNQRLFGERIDAEVGAPLYFRIRQMYSYNIQFSMREEIIEPNIKYSKIGENRRKKLIDLVVNEGYKARRASKMLKINQSTAKSILKLYRTTGTFCQKPKPPQNAHDFLSQPVYQEKPPQDYTFGSTSNVGYEEAYAYNTAYPQSYCPQLFYNRLEYYSPFYIMFPNTI